MSKKKDVRRNFSEFLENKWGPLPHTSLKNCGTLNALLFRSAGFTESVCPFSHIPSVPPLTPHWLILVTLVAGTDVRPEEELHKDLVITGGNMDITTVYYLNIRINEVGSSAPHCSNPS